MITTFYKELDAGVLEALKCSQCGAVSFPPDHACTVCDFPTLEPITISGAGELQVYCLLPEAKAAGEVWLEEGRTAWAPVEGVDTENTWQGNAELPLPVEAAIRWDGTEGTVVFRLMASTLDG